MDVRYNCYILYLTNMLALSRGGGKQKQKKLRVRWGELSGGGNWQGAVVGGGVFWEGNCPGVIVLGDYCLGGNLPLGGNCPGGNCLGGLLSRGQLSQGELAGGVVQGAVVWEGIVLIRRKALLPVLKTLVCRGRGSNQQTPAHEADALTTRSLSQFEKKNTRGTVLLGSVV